MQVETYSWPLHPNSRRLNIQERRDRDRVHWCGGVAGACGNAPALAGLDSTLR